MANAKPQGQHSRWTLLLLCLCAVGFALVFAATADWTGLGGRAWFGYWDSTPAMSDGPYVISEVQPRSDGAAARAGLRDGDRIDLREQPLDTRTRLLFQLLATRPTTVAARRGASRFTSSVVGSTVWESASPLKVTNRALLSIVAIWFLGCALLIAIRRSSSQDGRMFALVLIFQVALLIKPAILVLPAAKVSLIFFAVAGAFAFAASLLLLKLSSRFGTHSNARRFIGWIAYAVNSLVFLETLATVTGIFTLWIDPLPYLSPAVLIHGAYGSFWNVMSVVAPASVAAYAVTAVASAPRSERPRAAWLLLPLPIAFTAYAAVGTINGFVGASWFVNLVLLLLSRFALLLGALAVTYALLNRRILDTEFVLSRTLAVGTVSLIVVAAFVLLEWALGTILAGVSHVTGLIANAGLALVLGLSLSYIHKIVDKFVERVFFRKRHDDERALRDFSKEAQFFTDRDALLDQAIGKVREHTDSRAVALFIRGNDTYKAVREFGQTPAEVGENDPAILALKAWHKPLDPHQYVTTLHGALALPMVSRGQLLGILLCGERAGGEAYAPDEVDALAVFAHGVGSAFDVLQGSASRLDGNDLVRAIEKLSDRIVAIGESNAAEMRKLHESHAVLLDSFERHLLERET